MPKSLETLVRQNNNEAKYQLAVLLLNGRGVNKSPKRAIKLLKQTAKILPESSFLLGSIYYKGTLVEKSDSTAKKYLQIAADAGYQRAINLLEKLAINKLNTNRAKPQTQRLFELALSSGNLSLVIQQYLNGANLNYPNSLGNPPLITAMLKKRQDVANWLIKQKIDLKKTDAKGNSSLHIAAKLGQTRNAIDIAKQMKNLDQLNNEKQTALIIAVIKKQTAIAQWLANHGSQLSLKDSFGKSALDYNQIAQINLSESGSGSSRPNQKKIAQKQIKHQLKSLKTQATRKSSPYFRWPVMAIAVAQSQTSAANSLLVAGNDPWQETPDHSTAVSLSLKNGHNKLFKQMLAKSPIKTQRNPKKIEHLLFIAIEKDRTDLIHQLLTRAKKLNLTGLIERGLESSVKEQNAKSVKLFLSIKKGKLDDQLLSLSISERHFDVTKMLLKNGLFVDWQNEKGETPLMLAAQKSNPEAMSILLEKNAKIALADKQGLTALMWATKKQCLECVQQLILKGAHAETQSNNGNNAVMFAAQKSDAILQTLLSLKPKLSLRNENSFTALMLAVTNKCIDCVRTLIANEANPRRKNTKGQDSFDLASGNQEIIDILDQY
ncbi:MAG: ankyrin repeat domain-containing protein [Enterobacterales bacterium]|nr:ankyrin repeat domain-containing protein [Enterobacterales bacterium]